MRSARPKDGFESWASISTVRRWSNPNISMAFFLLDRTTWNWPLSASISPSNGTAPEFDRDVQTPGRDGSLCRNERIGQRLERKPRSFTFTASFGAADDDGRLVQQVGDYFLRDRASCEPIAGTQVMVARRTVGRRRFPSSSNVKSTRSTRMGSPTSAPFRSMMLAGDRSPCDRPST